MNTRGAGSSASVLGKSKLLERSAVCILGLQVMSGKLKEDWEH